jgi:hypothetical protein
MTKKQKQLFEKFKALPTYKKCNEMRDTIEKLMLNWYWGNPEDTYYIVSIYGIDIGSESGIHKKYLDVEDLEILFMAEIIINKKKIKNAFST